jgi:hypothetical protein
MFTGTLPRNSFAVLTLLDARESDGERRKHE